MIRKASYPLLKLHCAGCAHRSEGIAAKVEGVEKASANFAAGLLYVEYDPERFRAEDLKAAKLGACDFRKDASVKACHGDIIRNGQSQLFKRVYAAHGGEIVGIENSRRFVFR